MKLEATVDNILISTKTKRRRPPGLQDIQVEAEFNCAVEVATVASPQGKWVGQDPLLMFRPLLRLAQIR